VKPVELTLGSDIWCPYVCYGEEKGLAYDLLQEAFRPYNVTIVLKYEKWSDVILSDGHLDVTVTCAQRVRNNASTPKNEVGAMVFGLYSRGLEYDYDGVYIDLATLEGRIGVCKYFNNMANVYQVFKNYEGNEHKLVFYNSVNPIESMFNDLFKGHIDFLYSDASVVTTYERALGVSLKNLGYDKRIDFIYPMFDKHNKYSANLVRIWDYEIKKMRADGRLDFFLRKYQIRNWRSNAAKS
jgi:hypothetical protein